MDFQRLILVIALSFTLLLMWQAWQEDYGPKDQQATVAQQQAPSGQDVPAAPAGETAAPPGAPERPGLTRGQRIRVYTDVYYAEIDTTGGDLRHVELLHYPVAVDKPDQPTVLLSDAGELFVAQSGLLPSSAAPDAAAPSHHAQYTAEQTEYRLADGADSLTIPLRWTGPDGITVEKTYTFKRGNYVVDLRQSVQNGGAREWRGHAYRQWLRSKPEDEGSAFVYTYTGAVIYGKDVKYTKVDFDDMDETNLSRDLTGGWVAMIQHYFLGAWIPPQDANNHVYTKPAGDSRYIVGVVTPELVVGAGQSGSFESQLFVGPKLQDVLEKVAPGLELTVDYGWLTVIAKPLFWTLDFVHGLIGNWGWSIVILTILIKLVFYKLSETSYKSMAHMRKVQPRLVALKERYGDDRQKMNEAMMKLYREEKINPLGGCLPILVQIPVFIALYWVLLESVELRQADWILWINDLSIADPYFVLPVLMGATMLIQHWLNPTPLDPIQAKVMMILPIVFTVFFAFFPAGLVLYWVVNNTLSIAQQWYITRSVEKA